MAVMRAGKCRCGCGEKTSGGRRWMSGHDHRAVTRRIRSDFGDVDAFITWYDGSSRAAKRTLVAANRRAA